MTRCTGPPFWEATVLAHELRRFDIAAFRVVTSERLDYLPGQSGVLTYDLASGRDVLLVAGSTGLAPLKAITEQIAALADPPKVHLFFGARTADSLYDLTDLEKMAAGYPWLTVVPAVSDDPRFGGERGRLPDVVARAGNWHEHDAYVCGPTPMVEATVTKLTTMGVPQSQIHSEDLGWSEA
jgi:NAD(P)H-flavin reductase